MRQNTTNYGPASLAARKILLKSVKPSFLRGFLLGHPARWRKPSPPVAEESGRKTRNGKSCVSFYATVHALCSIPQTISPGILTIIRSYVLCRFMPSGYGLLFFDNLSCFNATGQPAQAAPVCRRRSGPRARVGSARRAARHPPTSCLIRLKQTLLPNASIKLLNFCDDAIINRSSKRRVDRPNGTKRDSYGTKRDSYGTVTGQNRTKPGQKRTNYHPSFIHSIFSLRSVKPCFSRSFLGPLPSLPCM